jgi:glycosyltransferase involved in cell wall biosynthesis
MLFRQKRKPQIAIAHEFVAPNDAIGNDMIGMSRLFSAMGLEPCLIGESVSDEIPVRVRTVNTTADQQLEADLMIYHHSIYWDKGDQLLSRFQGQVVFRYHSVTPPSFFEPYSRVLSELCGAGIRQTSRLVKRFRRSLWLADSEFNRSELVEKGADPGRVFVIPPFNLAERFLSRPGAGHSPIRLLFVGRFAPNKGHRDLVRILHSYVEQFGRDIELKIVGPINGLHLGSYVQEIQTMIDDLGLPDLTQIMPPVPFEVLLDLYRNSSFFLCCSRHEGFCVPAIEAQATGLPVIGVNAGALAETLGADQLIFEIPDSAEDYQFLARVIRELASDAGLRESLIRNGYRNVITRFTNEATENALLTALLPVLSGL